MNKIEKIINDSTIPYLNLPAYEEITVPISQIKYMQIQYRRKDSYGYGQYGDSYESTFLLCLFFDKHDYAISFDTREEAKKGRDMLVSFIAKNLHPNEITDLKNDIEELKDMIKYLPMVSTEYKKAKNHFHNPDSK